MSFKGSALTWWNGRSADEYIFKRLDKIVVDPLLQNGIAHIEVDH